MYKIIGDLKQKGEPTPDNPVEIENENYLIEEKNNKIIKKIPLGKIDLGEIELAKAKEKSADQMFEELGYRKNFEDKHCANFENDMYETIINFDKDYKYINIYNNAINMQELQAINKKVEELRMDLNDEYKKAIQRCNELIKVEHANWIGISNQLAIIKVLNLIGTQQEEIKNLNFKNEVYKKTNDKLEKVIDKMAEDIYENDNFYQLKIAFEKIKKGKEKDFIKERFYRKVEEDEKSF